MSDNGAHDFKWLAGKDYIMPHLRKVEGFDGVFMAKGTDYYNTHVGHNEKATIYFTIPKDHIFQFWVFFSTEANYDYLRIHWKAFGHWEEVKSLSGSNPYKAYWSFRSGVTVNTDTVVRMTYSKDGSTNGGSDIVNISGFLTKFDPNSLNRELNIKQSRDFSSQRINHSCHGHWIEYDEMLKADGTVWGNY